MDFISFNHLIVRIFSTKYFNNFQPLNHNRYEDLQSVILANMTKTGRPIKDISINEGILSEVNYSGKKAKDIPKKQFFISTKTEPKTITLCNEKELMEMAVKRNIILSGKCYKFIIRF